MGMEAASAWVRMEERRSSRPPSLSICSMLGATTTVHALRSRTALATSLVMHRQLLSVKTLEEYCVWRLLSTATYPNVSTVQLLSLAVCSAQKGMKKALEISATLPLTSRFHISGSRAIWRLAGALAAMQRPALSVLY